MSRRSPKPSTSIASRYLAACSGQPEAMAMMTMQSDSTRPFSPPTVEWKDPADQHGGGGDSIQYYQQQQQSRSTTSSPSRSRTPSRRDSAPDNSSSSPFRRSSFFRATHPTQNHKGGGGGDDTSLTQTSSSMTSGRKTPSSRGSGIAPSTMGGHHADGSSSIESTERISDRSSTPPLVDEEERYEQRDKSPASSWRRRLEGTANTKSPSRSRGTSDNSWIKKKAPARQLGRSPPRSHSPPRPLTAETIKERMQPSLDPATAPTEVMMNLSHRVRPSPDQMTTVSGAPTEVITNRAADRPPRQLDDGGRDAAFPGSNNESAQRLPPPSSRGTTAQRPQPVYPQKPVDINSLISASSNDDSAMTPINSAPVADFPVGRLGRHVNGKSAEHQKHNRKAGDDSRASAGDNSSLQTKSITSSVGVETGEHHFNKPPAALKSVFGGQGDLVRRNVQERYGFGALKRVEEPESEDAEQPPPPVTTPRRSPTGDDRDHTLLAENKEVRKTSPTRDTNNPFVVNYDAKTSPPSERKLYLTGNAPSGESSSGWTPAPLSSASGIESTDFYIDPNATPPQLDGSKKLLQPVFSPDRVDMDEQSPLTKWSSNAPSILPAPPVESSEDENGPPRIMRVTEKAASDVSPPVASPVAQVLASGSARRAALFQRRKCSAFASKESTKDRKESILALISDSEQLTNQAAKAAAPTPAGTEGSVHHHDMDPTEQPTTPKHAWPISIAVPTTRPSDTVETSKKQDEVETARKSPLAAAISEARETAEVDQPAPSSHTGVPTSSARASSAVDSEINNLTHRQLLVMAAHLAASVDEVPPAERYNGRRGIIGAARVDIDNVSSGEIQSIRSLLESSLGSKTSLDDETVGEQSVQSILSNLAGQPENEVAAAIEELARVSKMRAMFEPQKAPVKEKTFSGNNTLKHAFSVFEKGGPEQTVSQSIKTSSATVKPAATNSERKVTVNSKSTHEGGSKLQSSRAVFETQQRPITPTNTVRRLGTKANQLEAKEPDSKDSGGLQESLPTNPWKAQMMARRGRSTTPEKIASSKDSTEKPEGTKPRIDERSSALHHRWKAQMIERSKPSGTVGKEGARIPTETQSTAVSSTSAISSHNPWKAQLSDQSEKAPGKECAGAEPNAKRFEMHKSGSESATRAISPHDRWKAQMMERSKGSMTPTKQQASTKSISPTLPPQNRWKAQMLERSKRPVTPAKEHDMGEKKPQPGVTVHPISPHDRWKEQIGEQSKRTPTPTLTKERSSDGKGEQKGSKPTSSEVIAPPISPHIRWKAQMMEQSSSEKSPVLSHKEAKGAEKVPVTAESSATLSSNPWKSKMMTRSRRSPSTVAAGGHKEHDTITKESEKDHKDTRYQSQAVLTSMPAQNRWKKPASNIPSNKEAVESGAGIDVTTGEKDGNSVAERIKAFKVKQSSDSKASTSKSPRASPTWKRKKVSTFPLADSEGAEDLEGRITPTKGPAWPSRNEHTPSTVASTPWKDSPDSKNRAPHLAASPSSAGVKSPDASKKTSRNLAASPEPRTPAPSYDDSPKSPYPSVRDRISAFSSSPKTPPPMMKSHRPQSPRGKTPSDSEGGVAVSSTAEMNNGTGRGRAPPPDEAKTETVKVTDNAAIDKKQTLDFPMKSENGTGVKSTIYVSKKPLKPGNDRPPIDPSGSKAESEYEDGVTLDLSIAEVSALTNPTCLQSKGDLNDMSTGSSEDGTGDKSSGIDVTEEKRPSEASSSQMSEAAAPLIARMLYSRSDASAASMRITRTDPRATAIDEEAPQETVWDLNNVVSTFPALDSTTKTAFGFQSLEADDWQPFQSSRWDEEASGQWEAPDDKFFNTLAAEGARSPARQRHASPSRSRASTPKQSNTKYTSSRATVAANDLPHDLLLPTDTSGMPAGAVFSRTHPKKARSEPGHASGSDSSNGLSKHAALMMKLKSLKESRIRRHAAGSFHPSAAVHPTDKVPPRPSSTGSALTPRLYSGKGLAAHLPNPGPDHQSIGDDEHSASTKSSTRFGGVKFDELCLELD